MNNSKDHDWVLPASIPFDKLKARDLEECLYWLFDAMGAKDLEWRTGGTGGGAADGGRDLEAHFYTPGIDDEVEPQSWWIECKGRKGTVEASEVKEAVNNAEAKKNLDYVVIATNTQFSNPTRDWVKQWQGTHLQPKVRLWDSAHLERLLSKHPEVVLRLFSEALSPQGRYQAMETRFWNKLEFVPKKQLSELWDMQSDLEFSELGILALIANEFVLGNITKRSWGATLDANSLIQVLHLGLLNAGYLFMRISKTGVDEKPIIRALVYLILCALKPSPADPVCKLIMDAITRSDPESMPENMQEFLLMPIIDQLLAEMQDVCGADCERMLALDRNTLTQDQDEIESYWQRLNLEENSKNVDDEPRRMLRFEKLDAPCCIGFPVDKENHCPLFDIKPTVTNLIEVLEIVKNVSAFRQAQQQCE